MKIDADMGLIYEELKADAKKIILSSRDSWPSYKKMELAHDLTVKFLYSPSFNFTFDSSKGTLKSFFGSYIRKTLISLYDFDFDDRIDSEECSKIEDTQSSFELQYECRDLLLRGRKIMKELPNKEKNIKFYNAFLESVLNCGSLNYSFVAERCGVSRSYARVFSKQLLDHFKRRCCVDKQ